MKWFKHYTNASDNEFLAELEDEFGWEGYGRWWKLLEKIGQNMGGENGCSATYPWSDWQRFLKGKRSKLEYFFAYLEGSGKVKLRYFEKKPGSFPVHSGFIPETNRKQTGNEPEMNSKRTGNILEIECPKVLEIKDEYSRKSGQTPKQCPDIVPPKSKEVRDKNKEKDKNIKSGKPDNSPPETSKPTTPSPSKPPVLEKERLGEEFDIRWKRYRGEKDSRKRAIGHWNASVKSEADLRGYDKAEQNYYAIVEADRGSGFAERRYKNGKTWFNNWRDYIDQSPIPTGNSPPEETEEQKTERRKRIDKAFEEKTKRLEAVS